MEMGDTISQGLNVELPRSERFVDCSSHFGHLCEVEAPSHHIQVEDFPERSAWRQKTRFL